MKSSYNSGRRRAWLPALLLAPSPLPRSLLHGFVVEFETEADRDYYVSEDPAHQDFIKFAGEILQNVKVIDYEPGKL